MIRPQPVRLGYLAGNQYLVAEPDEPIRHRHRFDDWGSVETGHESDLVEGFGRPESPDLSRQTPTVMATTRAPCRIWCLYF